MDEMLPATQQSDPGDEPQQYSDAIDVDAMRRERVRAIASNYLKDSKTPRVQFSNKRKARFIELIGDGFTHTEAARAIGISPNAISHAKKQDEKFAEAVAEAAIIGADPVVERLQAIALYGHPERMATVRAGELYLKGVHPAYQDKRQASAVIERQHPDGTVDRISARANGVPD